MKALIIEDEYPAAERLERLVRELSPPVEVLGIVGSVKESFLWLKQHPLPDLIFADIQLSDGLSFDIFDKAKLPCPIIFTTAFDEYALRAFRHNSIDYLLKPIKAAELEKAVGKLQSNRAPGTEDAFSQRLESMLRDLRQEQRAYKTRFLVKSRDGFVPISEPEIAYFHTAHESVYLMRKDGRRFVLDYSLEELGQCMNPEHFYRVSRQYLCSIDAIRHIHDYFNGRLKLELQPAVEEMPTISREKAGKLKRWLEGEK